MTSLALPLRILGGCAALTLGACAVGDLPSESCGGGPQRICSGDPSVEARLDGLDIICESTLNVTGTFEPGMAQPPEVLGCWPVGTWTINATIDRLGCNPQPDITETYVYNVWYDEELSTIGVGFLNAPEDDRVNLKISTEGDSLCHGGMDHFALDGSVTSFRPTLQLDGTLSGIGAYTLHNDDTF